MSVQNVELSTIELWPAFCWSVWKQFFIVISSHDFNHDWPWMIQSPLAVHYEVRKLTSVTTSSEPHHFKIEVTSSWFGKAWPRGTSWCSLALMAAFELTFLRNDSLQRPWLKTRLFISWLWILRGNLLWWDSNGTLNGGLCRCVYILFTKHIAFWVEIHCESTLLMISCTKLNITKVSCINLFHELSLSVARLHCLWWICLRYHLLLLEKLSKPDIGWDLYFSPGFGHFNLGLYIPVIELPMSPVICSQWSVLYSIILIHPLGSMCFFLFLIKSIECLTVIACRRSFLNLATAECHQCPVNFFESYITESPPSLGLVEKDGRCKF